MSDSNINTKSESMSGNSTNDNNENICIVCCKNVEIWSIGECDHPVCYECSIRMRVLSKQLECPICRQSLGKVIFTYDKMLYRELEAKNRSRYYNEKYKICFYTKTIQNAYYSLLQHPCPKCNLPPFRKFAELRNHVLREHDLYYCDLCTDNLKIFSFERRCYTKAELSSHQRKGDADNRSHRGHPLCQFCNTRYLDRDELFRHLRRDHYFCHFCEADGCNDFYNDYASLREHFRKDHFLCEEGRCAKEEFTGAFRTEIDYKAHVANVHGKSLNKQQVKQARTLQLELTFGSRGRAGQPEPHITSVRTRGNEENHEVQPKPIQMIPSQDAPPIDARNEQDFPSLGGGAASTLTLLPAPIAMRPRLGASGLARTKENFPALGGADSGGGGGGSGKSSSRPSQILISSVIKKTSSPTSTSIHISNRPSTSASSTKKSNAPIKSDFPALPGTSKNAQQAALREDMVSSNSNINMNHVSAKHRSLMDDYVSVANPTNFNKIQLMQREAEEIKAKKAVKMSNAPKLNSQDFPALAMGPKLAAPTPASWTKTQKQRDAENRKSKVAPAPLLNTNTKSKPSKNNLNGGSASNNNQASEPNNNKKEKKNKKSSDEGKKSPDAISSKQEKENDNENKPMNSNITPLLNNGNTGNSSDDNSGPNFVHRPVGPPPGFISPIGPPPGFQNVTLKSVAKSPNNLTFTNSLGESYNIVPTYMYIQPPEFIKRNQKLITQSKKVLDSPEALEQFRQISLKFREGIHEAEPYYKYCQSVLKDEFDTIFPELLSLLPDITKQQALYLVHSQHLQSLPSDQKKLFPKLEVCSTCKQVLMASDAINHNKLHAMHESFPGLGDVEVKGSALANMSRK